MLHTWDISIPTLMPKLKRRAYLYLPRAYEENPNARFPVLYMLDGQNVFLDSEASFGRSWGMYDYMNETDTPLIIAAVSCNPVGNNRLCEYSPFTYEDPRAGLIEGRGRLMLDWMTRRFKPMIDRRLRTLPDRSNTLIAGSSMGGLLSLYAVTHNNDVFSRAACLSPSLWVNPARSRRMLQKASLAPDTMIYMDYGAQEMANHEATRDLLLSTCQSLYVRGTDLTFRIVPGGTHSEDSWRAQVPVFMKCLGF